MLYQLSYFRILRVGVDGLEPPMSSDDRFTVCCNSHYATLPILPLRFDTRLETDSSQQRDSNPRPTDYKSVALPTELCWHNTGSYGP